jgi:hypothetical protein
VFGKPFCDGEPDTLRRTSDERSLACRIEQFKCPLTQLGSVHESDAGRCANPTGHLDVMPPYLM